MFTSPFALILLFLLPQLSQSIYWGLYPACAQPQLQANAPAECETGGAPCLCASSTFLTGAAQAIWAHCGCYDLQTSAQTAASICNSIGSEMAVTQAEMISAGDGGQSSCSDPSGLSSSTSQPSTTASLSSSLVAPTTGSNTGSETGVASSSNSNSGTSKGSGGGGGLSTKDQIIIGVVVPVVGILVAVLGIGFTVFTWLRSRREAEQHQQVDPGYQQVSYHPFRILDSRRRFKGRAPA